MLAWTFGIIFGLVSCIANSDATQEIVTVVGGSVILECATNLSSAVDWKYQPNRGVKEVFVSSLGTINRKYSSRISLISPSSGDYHLNVTSVQLSDSGIYTCVEPLEGIRLHQIKLNVAAVDVQTRLVVAGSTATFECETRSSYTRWDFMPHSSTVDETIYLFGSVKSRFAGRFSVRHTASYQTLESHNVSASDAGRYTCMDVAAEDICRFELFVLGRPMECWTNLTTSMNVEEGDSIEVDCAIDDVNGTKAIVFCGDGAETLQPISKASTDGSRPTYRDVFTVSRRLIDSSLSCAVQLLSEDDNSTLYNQTWTSSALEVTYGPMNTKIDAESQNAVSHGDRLNCSAEGNPSPSYHWTYSGLTLDGQSIRFDVCQLSRTVSNNSRPSPTHLVEIMCVSKRGNRTDTANVTATVTLPKNLKEICHAAAGPGEDSIQLVVIISASVGGLVVVVSSLVVGVCYIRRQRPRQYEHPPDVVRVSYIEPLYESIHLAQETHTGCPCQQTATETREQPEVTSAVYAEVKKPTAKHD